MRKNQTRIYYIGLIMLLLVSISALATIDITQGLTSSRIILSSDYSNLNDDSNDTMSLSPLSLTLQNSGNISENVSLQVSSTSSNYVLGVSDNNFVLTASGTNSSSKTITLSAQVPVNVDSGNKTNIGKLKIGSTEYPIDLIVKSMLSIDDIKVYVNDQKEDTISDDGDSVSDIRPGDKVELKFRIKNLFDDDYSNGDIQDIELNVKFKDSNDEDDFGTDIDESDSFDLDAGQNEDEIVMTIKVPTDAKEQNYELEISLEGEDDNGASHKVNWDLELKVDRKTDDVQIETATLGSSTLDCSRSTTLKVKMTNYGSNTQREAGLTIYNKEMNISYSYMDLTLDKDPEDKENYYEKIIPISLSDNFKTGTYYIEVRAYIDDTDEVDHKNVALTVNSCSTTTSSSSNSLTTTANKNNDSSVIVVSTPTTTAQQPTTTTTASVKYPVTQNVETSFSQIKGVVIFMVVLAVLLATLIILVIYLLVKKRK